MAVVDAEERRFVKVAICTPCQDTVGAGFAYDLARLVGFSKDIPLSVIQSRGTIIPQQRAALVKQAVDYGATHLLFIDSDMRFPPNALERLLAHDQPIVAANYSTRRHPIVPTAEHKEKGMLFTPHDAEGLAEVSHAGMGLMLIEMAVFHLMSEPWFALGFDPKAKEYVGEDVFFCRQAKKSGFVTLVDQGLSREVRHVGEMEFRHEHALVTRDMWNKTETVAA